LHFTEESPQSKANSKIWKKIQNFILLFGDWRYNAASTQALIAGVSLLRRLGATVISLECGLLLSLVPQESVLADSSISPGHGCEGSIKIHLVSSRWPKQHS
jgi:hypothetical protein